MYKIFLTGLLLLLLISLVSAEDYAVSNSAHGVDVLSTISYANVKDIPFRFLNSPQSSATTTVKIGADNEVLVIQSTENAYAQTFKNDLENLGNDVEILESANPYETNLVLAQRSGADSFIIVDTTYGYNPLVAMPYATIKDAFILFADKDNANAVADFLKSKDLDYVLQYGYLDDAVKEALSGILTDSIDTGGKYTDSIAIVEKYIAETGTKQVVIMDGTFIEFGAAKGEDPILLISGVIPDDVYNFLLESNINTLVLIGGDLVPGVDHMKESLKSDGKTLSVFVKFGQTTPGIDSGVTVLDIFALPTPKLDLEIKSVQYNEATKTLEVLYDNKVDAVAYVIADIYIEIDGQAFKTIGDSNPTFITKGAEMGVQYDLDLSDLDLAEDSEIYARILAKYGSTETSLEKVVAGYFLITTINVIDSSELDITRMFYDTGTKQLSLTVKNTGDVDVYYIPTFDLQIQDSLKEFTKDEVSSLAAGKSKDIVFSGVELTDNEIAQNDNVKVNVAYGAREGFLTKSISKTLELEVTSAGGADYTILIILLVVIVCLLLVLNLKKKKKTKKSALHG